MAKQIINNGAFEGDPSAESIRESFNKAKSNFDELYNGEGVIYNENVTAILPAGDSLGPYRNGDIIPTDGMTTKQVEVILLLAQSTINPVITEPSFSLSLSVTGTREVGESYSATITGNYNPGNIQGKLVSGAWSTGTSQGNRAGSAISFEFEEVVTDPISNTSTVSKTLTLGNNVFEGIVGYSIGIQPKNSKGENYLTPLPAGTITATTTIVSRRKQFYGNVASLVVPTTSAEIRALPLNNFDNVNSIVISITTKLYVIAIPSSKSITSIITSNNENITSNFELQSPLNVNDAGAGSSEYKVYILESDLTPTITATVILS